MPEAIEKAREIAAISPDAIMATRAALRQAMETGSVERAFQIAHEDIYRRLMRSDNTKEGLVAFKEKRRPKWIDSKL